MSEQDVGYGEMNEAVNSATDVLPQKKTRTQPLIAVAYYKPEDGSLAIHEESNGRKAAADFITTVGKENVVAIYKVSEKMELKTEVKFSL